MKTIKAMARMALRQRGAEAAVWETKGLKVELRLVLQESPLLQLINPILGTFNMTKSSTKKLQKHGWYARVEVSRDRCGFQMSQSVL